MVKSNYWLCPKNKKVTFRVRRAEKGNWKVPENETAKYGWTGSWDTYPIFGATKDKYPRN